MLDLIGFSDIENLEAGPSINIPYDQRKDIIRSGRLALKDITGADFGYDLVAWQMGLLSKGEHYMAGDSIVWLVEQIKKCASDPVRMAIVADLVAEEKRPR